MEERFRLSPDLVQRFFREAVAASKVEHPAITQVFDAGVHEDSPFLVMELLTGEDLEQRLAREGKLSLDETMLMARPILSALDAAHRAGIVHRDIKPPNIFLARRPDGVVTPKLLDFGIAKHINDPSFDQLTASGSVLGTPLYSAPEQLQSDADVDHRADIYSIGVTLFHCLTGTTPYEATTLPELIGKIFSESPRSLVELAPHVPSRTRAVIERCLARDPGDRPQTAAELLEGLSSAADADRDDDDKQTAFVQWGSERLDAAPRTPPTRHVPMVESEPLAHRPPPSSPVQSRPSPEEPEAMTPVPRRRGRIAALVAIAGLMLAGLGVIAGVVLWFFAGDANERAHETPPAVVTTPPSTPPVAQALDAGAPMEPAQNEGAAMTRAPEEEGRAQLQVEAHPPGNCYIDGELVGSTPLTEWVSAGSHSVSVVYGPMHRIAEDVELHAGEYRVLRIEGNEAE
jgi:hypothetical protein